MLQCCSDESAILLFGILVKGIAGCANIVENVLLAVVDVVAHVPVACDCQSFSSRESCLRHLCSMSCVIASLWQERRSCQTLRQQSGISNCTARVQLLPVLLGLWCFVAAVVFAPLCAKPCLAETP